MKGAGGLRLIPGSGDVSRPRLFEVEDIKLVVKGQSKAWTMPVAHMCADPMLSMTLTRESKCENANAILFLQSEERVYESPSDGAISSCPLYRGRKDPSWVQLGWRS